MVNCLKKQELLTMKNLLITALMFFYSASLFSQEQKCNGFPAIEF